MPAIGSSHRVASVLVLDPEAHPDWVLLAEA